MGKLKISTAAGALLIATACGSGSASTSSSSPSPAPSVSFDAMGRHACQDAAKDAWLAAQDEAKLSAIQALQDLALREEKLGNHGLIKAWCGEHFHG